jgi:hypothetical protein
MRMLVFAAMSFAALVIPRNSDAQVILTDIANTSYDRGLSQSQITDPDIFTCTVYWDNWVYAYKLKLIAPGYETLLPAAVSDLRATLNREKWLLHYQITHDLDQNQAWAEINGASDIADRADADMNGLFAGNGAATSRVFETLGSCPAP